MLRHALATPVGIVRSSACACRFRSAALLRRLLPLVRRQSSVVPPRHTALLAAIKQLESSFGRNTVMRLGDRKVATELDVISTGSIGLDHALGIGGLPKGRIVEIYGAESSGKTTLALHVIAEAQKRALQCVFIDAEHAIDPAYARGLGVDLDALFISQPDSGEQALEVADTLVRSGGIDVVVVDSVAALVPKAEIEGEMGDAHMALQARLMSQALRKLTSSLSKSKTLIIFINQIRSKVGVIFGSPDVTSGGNALKFYASLRLEIKRTGVVKAPGTEEAVGNLVKVKVAKNKLAPPFRTAEFELTYGRGINVAGEIVDLGLLHGVLVKSGSWIRVDDEAVVKAVNDALDGEGEAEGGASAPVPAPSAAPPSAGAVPSKAVRGKKGGKGNTRRGVAEEGGEEEGLGAEPALTGGVAPALSGTDAPPPSVRLLLAAGEPFAQGRERAKAFFEEHPGAGKVVMAAIRRALADKAAAPALPPLSRSPARPLVDDMFANPSGQSDGGGAGRGE